MINREMEGRGAATKQAPAPGKATAESRRKTSIPIAGATAAYHAERFKEAHPGFYEAMADIAIGLRRSGERVSIARVCEVARVSVRMEEQDTPFKLNNTMRAALARMLMRDYPELAGAFEVRKSMSDGMLNGK